MSYSDFARSICPPSDRKRGVAPARTGRAARVRVGTYNSPQRRRDVLLRLADRVNAQEGILTVAGHLRQLGAGDDIVRRYASPVGRKLAAAYRDAMATEPEHIALAVGGRGLVRASGYRLNDAPLLDAVIESYEMADPSAPKSRKAPRIRLTDLIGA